MSLFPSLLLYPDNLTGYDGQTTFAAADWTFSGPVRQRTNAWGGQSYLTEDTTTNYVPNPWFAIDTTGWTGVTRDTSWAYEGPASGLITSSGPNAVATVTVTLAAANHVIGVVIRNNAAVARKFQPIYNGTLITVNATETDMRTLTLPNAGAVKSGNALSVPAGATVYFFSNQFAAVASAVQAGVQVLDSAAGETFNIGYLGVEKASFVSSPCPEIDASGNLISGHSWSGTAHNSTSTRTPSNLRFNKFTSKHINVQQGEFAARYRGDHNAYPLHFWGQFGPGYTSMGCSGNGAGTVRATTPGTQSWRPPVDYFLSLNWDDATCASYINSVKYNELPTRCPGNLVTPYASAQFETYGWALWSNFAIFPRKLTTDERTALMAVTGRWTWGMIAQELGGVARGVGF